MNIKDKLKLFNRIRDDKHAGADFRLLVAKVPSYPYITRFSRDVRRYAYDILYALLDVASEEEIVENRKLLDGKKQEKKNTPKKTPKQGSSKTSSKNAESKSESKEEEIAEDGSSKTLTDDSSKKKQSRKRRNTPTSIG